MFDEGSVIVGLEIGTAKVCAVAGELSEGGALNIIGIGQAKSRGVRKGEIVDGSAAGEDIRNAVVDAEQMADAEIRSVYLAVTGGHIRGVNNRGFHPIASADREITEDDIQDALKNARAVHLPAENRVIHVIRQHFSVDGHEGIQNPLKMCGARLELDAHVVHGEFNRLQNPIRAVQGLQLEVEDVVFSGLASSHALLTQQQRELGAVVIDLGAGTTEFAVYAHGIIKHTGALAVGGDHVSNDLAYGLKIPLARAEQLKIEHGSAVCESEARGRKVPTAPDLGFPEKSVNLEHLQRIMSARMEETFQLIADDLDAARLLDHLRAGVFLCGGGARARGICRLAERVFGLPTCVGQANSVSGLRSALDQPEFATGIGLVKFGAFDLKKRAARRGTLAQGIKSTIGQLFGRTAR